MYEAISAEGNDVDTFLLRKLDAIERSLNENLNRSKTKSHVINFDRPLVECELLGSQKDFDNFTNKLIEENLVLLSRGRFPSLTLVNTDVFTLQIDAAANTSISIKQLENFATSHNLEIVTLKFKS